MILQKLFSNLAALIAVTIFIVACVLAYSIRTNTEHFEKAYRDYAVAAAASDEAAYAPSVGNNPTRVELNNDLTQILGNTKLSPAERLSYARRSLVLVSELEKQIDTITPALDTADKALETMSQYSKPIANFFSKGIPNDIVRLAHERHEAVNDIRAYSYRADSESRKILEHIEKENGALSNAYVEELNNLVPAVEEEFNLRTNRYSDLQRISSEIDAAFLEFVKRFSPGKRE